MVKNGFLSFAAAAAIIAFASSATAAPITTAPETIVANGNVKLVYIGALAGDKSYLSLVGGPSKIFCNNAMSGCAASTAGQVAVLGTLSGPLVFTMKDTSVINLFDTANLASDGFYHANVVSNYADLGIFAEPAGLDALISSLSSGPGALVRYVGFEDRLHGDYDYNDFVFAVISTPLQNNPVPEPATLGLLGAGLLGLRLHRRRRA
jgi:hypothetical protein